MTGLQLAEKLLTLRSEMKVLFMCGYTNDPVLRHGIVDTTLSFIQKPITPEALARKVREALGSEGSTPTNGEAVPVRPHNGSGLHRAGA